MKKFLFTLAALFMVGTAFAANVYVPDTEFTADQIGKQQLLPLYVELDNEYINGWDFALTYPEGVTAGNPKKNTAVLNQMIPNADGDEEIVTPLGDCLANSIVQAYGTAGYWDPDDDGVFESYGAVKIGPDGTFKLYDLRVTPNEGFTGGDIVIDWMVSGGFDARNNQQPIQVAGQTIVHLTVPAAPQEKEDCESPSIVWAAGDNGEYYIQITPDPETDGALQYTVDVEPARVETVDGIVYLYYNRGEEDVPVHVVAWTAEGENYNASDEETADVTIPKLPQVATPEIVWTLDGNNIIINATCATEGATVTLYDPEGNAVAMPATVEYDPYVGYNATWTATATAPYMLDSETGSATITIAADDKTPVDSPVIDGYTEDATTYIIYIVPGETDGQLVYTANPMGTLMRADAVYIQYERKAEAYDVDVEAYTTEGATCAQSATETKTLTVPALDKTAKPTVTYSYDNGELTVWAYGSDDDAVYTLYCDGVEYTGEMPIEYDIYDGYGPHTWTATALAPNKQVSDESEPCEITIAEEEKVYYTDDPVINVVTDEENQKVIITVTGEGTITVDVVGFDVNEHATGTNEVVIEIPFGEEFDMVNIHATAVADLPEGYDSVVGGDATKTGVEIPALPEKADMPVITELEGNTIIEYLTDEEGNIIYAPDGKPAAALDENGNWVILDNGHWKAVTFEAEDGATVYYRIDGGEWMEWDGDPVFISNENGEYVVEAYAVVPDKRDSDIAEETIVINDMTSVNELVNGKTVASKRFFNMAGQEMTEANGVTIVVTTYTDGTTSAVKVIK